jgi:DNA processing protein
MSTLNKEEKISLLKLSCFSGFSPNTLKKMYNYFSSWHKAYNSNYLNLRKLNINEKTIDKFFIFRKNFEIKNIIEIMKNENINLLYFKDKNYPKLLKEIPDWPILLFYRGNIDLINKQYLLTVVGSRQTNSYGQYITHKLIKDLNKNIIIVSGLAYGIDTIAHQSALKNNHKTIAILGSGINKNSIYPQSNLSLAKNIIKNNGLVLSEFPPLTKPLKFHFPQRNRLLASLSSATLVSQAKEKSGALITAYLALDYNREVLSIPSNIDLKYSQGNNQLLKAGAKLILNHKDIEESLNIDSL